MDETTKLIQESTRGETASITLMSEPVYNIDDVDGKPYMMDHRMSGCFPVISKKLLGPNAGGKYYVNGQYAGAPIIGEPSFMGQFMGLFMRKWLTEYDTDYQIRLEGLVAEDGTEVAPFEITIHTLPKVAPGDIYPEHDSLVLQAAREGAVLLKNENALPLAKGSTLNAFGSGVAAYRLGCVGAGKINPRYGIRFIEGIEKYSSLELNRELTDFYMDEKDVLPSAEIMERAKAAGNTALFVISRPTGEGEDTPLTPGCYYSHHS